MRNYFLILCLLILNCDTGDLEVVINLPIDLNEISGLETDINNDLFWMVNDSGNKPILYGLNTVGNIVKSIKIKAKNRDWEDLTIDPDGNIYIGNFGNNDNDSNNLSILKIHADSLASDQNKIHPEVISFSYPEQKKFPPIKTNAILIVKHFSIFKETCIYLLKVVHQNILKRQIFTNYHLQKVTIKLNIWILLIPAKMMNVG